MRLRHTVLLALLGIGVLVILASVGGPAAWSSYHHSYEVALHFGEAQDRAEWLPLTTDGMLVAALIVMYWRRWQGQPIGRTAWAAFIAGSIATGSANIASAIITAENVSGGEMLGRVLVALWSPVSFAITLELVGAMLGFVREWVARLRAADAAADVWPATHMIGIPVFPYVPNLDDARTAALDTMTAAIVAAGPPPAPTRKPRARRTRTATPAPAPVPAAVPDTEAWTEEDEVFRLDLQTEVDRTRALPSYRSIKARYGIGQERAARIRGRLTVPAVAS